MPHTTDGIIYRDSTYGVDVQGDIAKVLGRNTGDLGQLCKDVNASGTQLNNINIMSRRKPTQYTGVDDNDTSQPAGMGITETDFLNGKYPYSINKPFFRVSGSQYNTTGDRKYISAVPSSLWGSTWSWIRPTKYRALDFDGYVHGSSGAVYPDTFTSSPYYASVSCILDTASALSFGAFIRYTFDDLQHGDYSKGKLLGMKSIFGVSGTYDAYFGFMAYAPPGTSFRNSPLCLIYLPKKLGEYDSTTGSYNMISVPLTETVSQTPNPSTSMFCIGETITVVPIIAKKMTESGGEIYWYMYSLGYKSVTKMTYTIPGTPIVYNTNEITALTITFTLSKDEITGEWTFYIAQANHFSMTASKVPDYNQRLRFAQPPIGVGPGDGNTYVQNLGEMTFGSQDSDWNNDWIFQNTLGKTFNASIINYWSIDTTPKQRAGSFTCIPYNSASSFIVSVSFAYYKYMKDFVRKNAQFTVPSNAQSGDTFTATFTF